MYFCDNHADINDIYQQEIDNILGGNNDMKTAYGFTRFDTEEEFKSWLKNKSVSRKVNRLQIHHTGMPDYSCFYKSGGKTEDELARQNSMKSFHVKTNGWSDIAQHFTVFPNGKIVTGRSLNSNPAGITGWNTGAICVEIYGNFDKGKDVMTDAQKRAVIMLYGELCKKFNLTPSTSTIRPHAWFTSSGTYLGDYVAGKSRKTCPGTNFMGIGNSKSAITNKFIPMVKDYISGKQSETVKEPESKPVETPSSGSFVVRVTANNLNIRKWPSSVSKIVGQVHKGEAYTITRTRDGWGCLKSGAGWICLAYTEKVK